MELFPHQVCGLKLTEGHTNCAWVVGYEGMYSVDESGNVYSTRSGQLKPWEHNGKQPYFIVSLRKNGSTSKRLVHRLVAEAFLPNPNKLSQVNHKDGNVHNNCVTNLEWVSNAGNTTHAYENQLRKKRTIYVSNGEKIFTLRHWCTLLGLPYKTVWNRVHAGWEINRALGVEGGDVYETVSTSD